MTELVLRAVARGISTCTDREASDLLHDVYIIGAARRADQLQRRPQTHQRQEVHHGGRTAEIFVETTPIERGIITERKRVRDR